MVHLTFYFVFQVLIYLFIAVMFSLKQLLLTNDNQQIVSCDKSTLKNFKTFVKEKPRLNAKAAHFRQIKNNVLTRRAKLTEKLRAEETQYADELKTAKNSHKEADFEAITRRFGLDFML